MLANNQHVSPKKIWLVTMPVLVERFTVLSPVMGGWQFATHVELKIMKLMFCLKRPWKRWLRAEEPLDEAIVI